VPQKLSLEVAAEGDAVTIRLHGEVDLAGKPLIDDAVDALEIAGRDLIIDLSGVTFMDTTGIKFLIETKRRCDAGGAHLVVASPTPSVRRLLEICSVHELLGLTDL
jgi:anti-anti-sigma factor